MSIYTHAFSCAALLLCTAIPAHADHLRVHVPLGKQGSLTAPSTDQVFTQIKKIPGGADVVPAKEFQNGYAVSMKDMLASTPGVLAQPRWGEESRLSIRGSGLSRGFHLRGITILQDGIPYNLADGSADFQELDPLTLQHIEVYRGGQGLRYGAATLGGAINAVTSTAANIDHNAMLRFEGGSFETKRSHGEAAYTWDNVDAFGSLTQSISNGYRQQSEQDNTKFNSNMGIKLSDNVETRFYASWNDINQEVPGTVSKASALNTPTYVQAVNAQNDYARDIKSLRLANRTVFDLGSVDLEVGAYANDKQLYHPIFQVIDQDSLDTGVFARLRQGDAVLGVNVARGVTDAERFVNNGGNRGALTARGQQLAENIELYGENRWTVADGWQLIGGFQAAIAGRRYSDALNATNDAEETYRNFNPKIGMMWYPAANTEVYTSLTRSSEAPTFSELVQGTYPGFVPVNAQVAWTAEIGSRGSRGAWSWDATIYRAHIKDEMLQYTVTPDVPASTFNAGETVHQGLELGLGYKLSDEWLLEAVYNYSDFYFDDDAQYGDNDLAGAAPHQVRVAATYEKNGFSVTPSVEWVPEAAYVDYANTLKSDSYAVLNAKASYDITDGAEIFMDARNLADTRYIPSFSTVTDARTANTNVFYPGDGRSVFVGVKAKF